MTGLFTIGHSLYLSEVFNDIISENQIVKIWDVRSSPFSKWAPQFNRGDLEKWLKAEYHYAGDDLGGRPTDMSLYTDGRVDFNLVMQAPNFLRCLDLLSEDVSSGKRVAIMCSEKDPVSCHRFVLISRLLKKRGFPITHVLRSSKIGTGKCLESQEELEQRMMGKFCYPSMFLSPEEALDQAYEAQGMRIAYKLNHGKTK